MKTQLLNTQTKLAMKLNIFTIWCMMISCPEILARYAQYDHPVYQNARIPWYGTYELIKPEPLKDEFFATRELTYHVLNMSAELLKDTYIKSIYSFNLQKEYQKDPRYKLGLFTAGVIDKFNHMVKIYKYYARPEIYEESSENEKKHLHVTNAIVQGYQIMQGDLNEIRVETELFFKQAASAKKGHVGDAKSNVDEFKGDMTEGDWNKMSKNDQDRKIEEYKSIYGTRRFMDARRSPDRLSDSPKVKFTLDAAQEEYKRSLRYKKWADKWNGFDSKVEGIEISSPLVKMEQNRSRFLGVNPFK